MIKKSKKKKKLHKPADFASSTSMEEQSNGTIHKALGCHGVAIATLEFNDKWPNIDGYVFVKGEDLRTIGKFEVQGKTLPKKHNFKFKCPIQFIAYCEQQSVLPVFLFCVDNYADEGKGRVYWLHFDREFISTLELDSIITTKTISLNENQYFSLDKKDYIQGWRTIVLDNIENVRKVEELEKKLEILAKSTNLATGEKDNMFIAFHKFLDTYNGFLDREFLTIKNLFYPKAWKIGLASYLYTDTSIDYTLYPIKSDTNDAQIKHINQTSLMQLRQQEGLGFTKHAVENPILLRPIPYAKELISTLTLKAIEKQVLNFSNKYLMQEYLIAFIELMYTQLGLNAKREYSIEEVENAIKIHLHFWTDEVCKLLIKSGRNGEKELKDCYVPGGSWVDPYLLVSEVMPDENIEIEKRIQKRLEIGENPPQLQIGVRGYNMGKIVRYLSELRSAGNNIIERPYIPRDFNRMPHGGLIWEAYSKKDVEHNINVFLNNLESVYNDVLDKNFPLLKEELSLFKNINKIVFAFKIPEKADGPIFYTYYLKSEAENDDPSIEIATPEERERFEAKSYTKWEIDFRGKQYKIIHFSQSVLDFIYEDTPMLDYIQKLLLDSIKEYFK